MAAGVRGEGRGRAGGAGQGWPAADRPRRAAPSSDRLPVPCVGGDGTLPARALGPPARPPAHPPAHGRKTPLRATRPRRDGPSSPPCAPSCPPGPRRACPPWDLPRRCPPPAACRRPPPDCRAARAERPPRRCPRACASAPPPARGPASPPCSARRARGAPGPSWTRARCSIPRACARRGGRRHVAREARGAWPEPRIARRHGRPARTRGARGNGEPAPHAAARAHTRGGAVAHQAGFARERGVPGGCGATHAPGGSRRPAAALVPAAAFARPALLRGGQRHRERALLHHDAVRSAHTPAVGAARGWRAAAGSPESPRQRAREPRASPGGGGAEAGGGEDAERGSERGQASGRRRPACSISAPPRRSPSG